MNFLKRKKNVFGQQGSISKNCNNKIRIIYIWINGGYGNYSQSYGFSSSHVCICKLDHREGSVQKNWCCQTVVLEKTFKNSLDSKDIKPVNPKGNQSWIFTVRTDAEAEAPILWQPDTKSWLIGKDPEAGKNWRQVEKGMADDEMVGWHHRLMGHEFEQTQGDSEKHGSPACCSPWG